MLLVRVRKIRRMMLDFLLLELRKFNYLFHLTQSIGYDYRDDRDKRGDSQCVLQSSLTFTAT
jgi:hypothetical protein